MKNKLFNENGFLNEQGVKEVKYLLSEEIDILMDNCESENDVIILQAALAKYLGDKAFDKRKIFQNKK